MEEAIKNETGSVQADQSKAAPAANQARNARPSGKSSRDNRGAGGGASRGGGKKRSFGGGRREQANETEYDQKILDLARVTRVMAGGKRMRFRACLAIGNRKGKVAIGLAKGVDVTAAITKAFNQAKKNLIEVPIVQSTIPHQVEKKFKASHIILKPARQGKGIICGGVVRVMAELAGIHNMTGKILGTGNNVANAKCMMLALTDLRAPKAYIKAKAKSEVAETAPAKN